MRSLITGATGFVGPYLAKLLINKGYTVCGTYLDAPSDCSDFDGVRLEGIDVTDEMTVRRVVRDFSPDEIYHLAGIAVTNGIQKETYYKTNYYGTIALLNVAQEFAPNSRVLIVGSSASYGRVPVESQPISEEQKLHPINHYAAAKAAADMSACAYAAEGLHVVRTRSFNHTGPGQSIDFVCSRLAKLISEVALGKRDPIIEVGNIESIRDFTDVRDVVRAYWLLLQKGKPGDVYNVCSQKGYSIKDIISFLINYAEIELELKISSDLIRQSDIPMLLGCRKKIFKDTGWEPQIIFEKTLSDLYSYWEQTI